MSLDPEFLSLPVEYQNVLSLAQEKYGIEVKPLQPLSGGKSGALLYLVSVTFEDGHVEHLVLKLDQPIRWEVGEKSEAEKQSRAIELAPTGFVQRHMAKLAFEPIKSENTLAIFYTIAGDSIQQCRPIGSFSSWNQLKGIFSSVTIGLLEDWNSGYASFRRSVHPRTLLEQWLGYRIKSGEGHIDNFLEVACQIINPNIPGFIVQGVTLPNPLAYARDDKLWASARSLDAMVGFLHGDLNEQCA